MLEVVIPLKDLHSAKSRLGKALDDDQRESLVVAMALDLIDLVSVHPSVAGVAVIAGEHWESHLPNTAGLRVLREADLGARGLNPLLERALATLQSRQTLLLHGDLPLLGDADLNALQRQLVLQSLVLCPDDACEGTNALAFCAHDRLPCRFGDNSFTRHRQLARQRGRPWSLLKTPGFALDIDAIVDLECLAQRVAKGAAVGTRVLRWLREQSHQVGLCDTSPRAPVPLPLRHAGQGMQP